MHMFNYYHAVRPDFKDTKAAINVDEAYIKLTLAAQSLWDNGLVSHQGGARYLIRLEIKDGYVALFRSRSSWGDVYGTL